MNNIEVLQDFIKRAERNYKYKPNTAAGLAASVKLFGTAMTDDELSKDTFPADMIDEITERIHVKFGDKYSVDSLQTYKSRMNRVAADFVRYGADAKSMASWNPLTKQRRRASSPKVATKVQLTKSDAAKATETSTPDESMPEPLKLPGVQDITLPLADNRNVVIYYPVDLNETEAEKIGTVLKSIASLSNIE
jgi:hypothetical protein